MKKYILPVLIAGSVAVPAMAQEASPFTGPRVEVLGGYDTLRTGSDADTDTGDGLFDNDGPDESVDGVNYGFGLGYDFNLNGIVLGVEGEFMESTAEQDSDEALNAPFGYSIDVSRDLYLGARLGYQVAPSTLVYAKGGYTSTRVRAAFEDGIDDDNRDFNFDTAESVEGYRVGAGVEQLLGDSLGFGNAYAKLEYRYSNYSNLSYDDDVFADDQVKIDLDRHQVIAGLGIRF